MSWPREQYDEWLATLRMGGAALAEQEEDGVGIEQIRTTALNIQIAWSHLNAPESPFRTQLNEKDWRTVSIARGITGNVGSEVM